MSTPGTVLTETIDGVFKITLNRPKANAFTLEMVAATQQALKQAARDPQVRCVLLSGAGGMFSAGQDVHQILEAEGQSFRQHLLNTYNPLILQIRQLEKPVLAAIQGTAAGAALGIALACDLRIAAEDARFVVGFLGIGLAPDSGISLFLPALIGLGRAAEFTFTNEPIPAGQALSWGLVNRLAPPAQLPQQAFEWAAELAKGPVHTMALAKRAFNKAIYPNLEQVLDYEAHLQEIASQGEEHKERVRAFLEKRTSKAS
jgi:2-(1,2-epoxy-1,2-dihydrophenyl)acetyl-CoA isomerase